MGDGFITVESLKKATKTLGKLVGLGPYEDEDKYEVYYNFFKWPLVDLTQRLYYTWINSEEYARLLLFELQDDLYKIPVSEILYSLGIDEIYIVKVEKNTDVYLMNKCDIWVILNDNFFKHDPFIWKDKIQEESKKLDIDKYSTNDLYFSVKYMFRRDVRYRTWLELGWGKIELDEDTENRRQVENLRNWARFCEQFKF